MPFAAVSVAATLLLLLVAFLAFRRISSRLARSLTRIETTTQSNLKAVEEIIKEKLRPSIHLHDSRESVATRSATAIMAASAQTNAAERFITFYGAAAMSLPPLAPGAQQPSQSPTEEDAPHLHYSRALDEATRNRVQIRRYISFFTPEEIRARSPQVQQGYLAWLRRQQYHLATDELFQLIDVIRAPKWGANMARILTHTTVIEVTGNGEAAIVIDDADAAATVREYSRRAIQVGKNPPAVYGLSAGTDTLDKFRVYLDSIEAALASGETP